MYLLDTLEELQTMDLSLAAEEEISAWLDFTISTMPAIEIEGSQFSDMCSPLVAQRSVGERGCRRL